METSTRDDTSSSSGLLVPGFSFFRMSDAAHKSVKGLTTGKFPMISSSFSMDSNAARLANSWPMPPTCSNACRATQRGCSDTSLVNDEFQEHFSSKAFKACVAGSWLTSCSPVFWFGLSHLRRVASNVAVDAPSIPKCSSNLTWPPSVSMSFAKPSAIWRAALDAEGLMFCFLGYCSSSRFQGVVNAASQC